MAVDIFKDTILPIRWMWCIINNLEKFNDRPEYILNLIKSYRKVDDHVILSTFENIIDAIEQCYSQTGVFPGVEKLKTDFRDVRAIYYTPDPFSMQIYDNLLRYIECEFIKQQLDLKVVGKDEPDVDDIRLLAKEMSRFADNTVQAPEQTKAALLDSYEDYSATFDGVKTYIRPVDDVIGVLGYQSLSVFAAPSGHGKSTFATSVAYYAACNGKCVDYLSFEIPERHMWFNLVSIESEGTSCPLPSSRIKESDLNEREAEQYKIHMGNMLKRIGESKGYLNIIDQTTANANTYEGLCAMLETVAEKRKRKADLIIIDNIDNLQTLRSYERDEIARVNNYIISLDGFSKKYCDGAGTSILLLSQVNRPGLKRLTTSASDTTKGVRVDVTCIQRYNALYEKATCVLLGYADETSRASGIMRIYPVKLRNKAVPEQPIQISVNYAYSKVRGNFIASTYQNQQQFDNEVRGLFSNTADFESNDMEDVKLPVDGVDPSAIDAILGTKEDDEE